MIKGMTGFGTATISSGATRGVVEIKSVNHRYFDVVYFLPVGFGALESKIRQRISRQLQRGRVTVSLKILEKPAAELSFNRAAVKEYLKYARTLKKEFGFDDQLALRDLIRLPGVVESHEYLLDPEDLWPAIDTALRRALRGMMTMRSREGRALHKDAADILRRMSMQIRKIRSRSKVLLREKKKGASPEEFSAFQKGMDINEELIRLSHYIEEFRSHLKAAGCVGKRLDFVAQEMQRETNTIGSKLQDRVVSNSVIALKSKIEKLREQAQNIE